LKIYYLLVILDLLVSCQKVSHAKLDLCSTAPLQVAVVFFPHRKDYGLLDSLEWSKTYDVLSFSRLTLSSRGFTNEQIASLTQEDLEHIADVLHTLYPDFEESVQFITALRLAEKRKE
jgi:hypothetical protein